jgi:hypothetical protein
MQGPSLLGVNQQVRPIAVTTPFHWSRHWPKDGNAVNRSRLCVLLCFRKERNTGFALIRFCSQQSHRCARRKTGLSAFRKEDPGKAAISLGYQTL